MRPETLIDPDDVAAGNVSRFRRAEPGRIVRSRVRPHPESDVAKKRLSDAETKLRRFQEAIAAGVDAAALVDVINKAQAERAIARAELESAPPPDALTAAEIYAMVDSLGDVGAALVGSSAERLASLYAGLELQVRYEPDEQIADVSARLERRVNSECVRRGT